MTCAPLPNILYREIQNIATVLFIVLKLFTLRFATLWLNQTNTKLVFNRIKKYINSDGFNAEIKFHSLCVYLWQGVRVKRPKLCLWDLAKKNRLIRDDHCFGLSLAKMQLLHKTITFKTHLYPCPMRPSALCQYAHILRILDDVFPL